MSIKIYYFSGSGNSLVIALDLAKLLNAKLKSIPYMMKREYIKTDSNIIGIIFPVYYAQFSGVPLIVKRFIKKLKNLNSKYMFAVCNHSGKPGRTIENLGKLLELQGGKLSGGFTVKMRVPYSPWVKIKKVVFHREINTPIEMQKDSNEQQKLYKKWKEKLQEIVEYVSNQNKDKFETTSKFKKVISSPLLPLAKYMFTSHYKHLAKITSKETEKIPNSKFQDLIHFADKSFQINIKCNSCGICARICPVENIKIVDDKPKWQHHCETCYTCFYWCPQEAIYGEIVEYNKRCHHPDVKLSDMLRQNDLESKKEL